MSFRTIVLDQIPFLNVDLFEMMVNTMPNLEAVTITRCQMLDVTKLKPLLEVIRDHPRVPAPIDSEDSEDDESQLTPQDYIRLDFAPYFFEGPTSAGVRRLGSYGVTYNEPTFHTPMAVFCMIMRCWDLSKKVGMDLVSDGSSFWRFVCRLPGPDVLWAMKAREAWIAYDRGMQAGRPLSIVRVGCADDLTAALIGDNQPHSTYISSDVKIDEHLRRHGQYWRTWQNCAMCKFTYPLSLFPNRAETCWGCKMDQFACNMEDSHLRLWQETVIRQWLSGINPRKTGLRPLLSREDRLTKVLDQVGYMDWTREYFLKGAETIPFSPSEAQEWKEALQWLTPRSASENGEEETKKEPQPFSIPPPKTLNAFRASLARWRWYRDPVTAGFDYRQGGPQREDPCKDPLDVASTQQREGVFDAERKVNFEKRWEWTSTTDAVFDQYWKDHGRDHPDLFRRRLTKAQLRAHAREDPELREVVRDEERWAQNKYDKEVQMWHNAHVDDCLISICTVGKVPFNLDTPLPDPRLNRAAYIKAKTDYVWRSRPYNCKRQW